MMLHEVDGRIVIDDLVPGGPAFKSNEVDAGDFIEAVDGVTVSPDNYHEKSALLHAQKPGQVLEASLRRMDRSEVNDNVELYELFMEIKSDLEANAPKNDLMQRVDACKSS
jgi:C-terminal processing protease CtpA/Prc